MGFYISGEAPGAGIFVVGPPDNAEFQMGGTAGVPDFRDRDVMPVLIADQWQPRGGQQGNAFLVLDECDDSVAADIMTPDLRTDAWLLELTLDECFEILTRVVASDQECFMTQILP